jgi:hypothetical protein
LGALRCCEAALLVLDFVLLRNDALEVLGVAEDVVALALGSVLPGGPLEQRALLGRRRRGGCGVGHDCTVCIGCLGVGQVVSRIEAACPGGAARERGCP